MKVKSQVQSEFARGAFKAQIVREKGGRTFIRLDGPINMRQGNTGMNLHPNVIRELAKWLSVSQCKRCEGTGAVSVYQNGCSGYTACPRCSKDGHWEIWRSNWD